MRLVLIDAPANVDYGIQRGRGSKYQAMFVQQRKNGDVVFDFSITVSESGTSGAPNFSGDFVQGTPARRFIYIDVGTYAGQKNTPWSRRMIVLLNGITLEQIKQGAQARAIACRRAFKAPVRMVGPSCATVKPIGGWIVVSD